MNDAKRRDEHDDDCVAAASQWLVRLQDPELSPETLLQWEQWIAESPHHRRAFDEIEQLSRRTHALKDKLIDIPLPSAEELSADHYTGSESVSEWLGTVTAEADHDELSVIRKRRRQWRILAAAAAIAALAIGVGVFGVGDIFERPGSNQLQAYETAASEHREIGLPDGSVITMGAKSSLSVSYTRDRRAVVLEDGEALFNVAKDAERPFIVMAGGGTITAVGTAFNVRHDSERVVVTVTEGTVEVAQSQTESGSVANIEVLSVTPQPKSSATLSVGQSVAYGAAGMTTVEATDSAAAIAWQGGRLQYRGELLKHVITGVNRYSSKEIIIADKTLENLVFTGSVFQDQAEDWLLGLEDVFPVEIVEVSDDKVLLKARDSR